MRVLEASIFTIVKLHKGLPGIICHVDSFHPRLHEGTEQCHRLNTIIIKLFSYHFDKCRRCLLAWFKFHKRLASVPCDVYASHSRPHEGTKQHVTQPWTLYVQYLDLNTTVDHLSICLLFGFVWHQDGFHPRLRLADNEARAQISINFMNSQGHNSSMAMPSISYPLFTTSGHF